MEKKRIYERIECLKKSSTSLLFELKGGLVIMEDRNRSFLQKERQKKTKQENKMKTNKKTASTVIKTLQKNVNISEIKCLLHH